MFKRAKSLLLSLALCAVSLTVPLTNSNTAKAASVPASSAAPTSWMCGSNLTCGTDDAFNSLDVMKKDGYNSVTLDWYTYLSAEQLDKYLSKCENIGLKPVVSLWDAYGKSDIESLEKCVNYWIQPDVVKVMRNHQSATIEVAAGWDPGDTDTWQQAYSKYLPLMDSAFQYSCNVCVATPSCTNCKTADEAAQKLNDAVAFMSKQLRWFRICYDVTIVLIMRFGDITIIKVLHERYYTYILAPIGTIILDPYPITIIKYFTIGCFPGMWCDKGNPYSMTSDGVNYTDFGKSVSKVLLS